jgi:Domain of unknown function (DUF397)
VTAWVKSSYSFSNGNCIEIATVPTVDILVRDSKLGEHSPILAFPAASWESFTAQAKRAQLESGFPL